MAMGTDDPKLIEIGRQLNDNNPVMMTHQVLPSQLYINTKFSEDNTGTGFKHGGRTVEEVGNDPGN
jgi:hypothetical protein